MARLFTRFFWVLSSYSLSIRYKLVRADGRGYLVPAKEGDGSADVYYGGGGSNPLDGDYFQEHPAMATRRPVTPSALESDASLEEAVQRYLERFPEVRASVERMRRRYEKHLVPIEELRADLDQALGNRSLTEALYRMRGT